MTETLVWWIVLFGAWVASLSTAPAAELIAAAAGSLLCAGSATAMRRIAGLAWRFRWSWLRWVAALPVAAAAETVTVLISPLRRNHAQWKRIPMPEEPTEEHDAGRRAAAGFVLSATPGSFLIDAAPGEPLLLHVLAGGGPELDRMVTR